MARPKLTAPAVRAVLAPVIETGTEVTVYTYSGRVAVNVARRAATFTRELLETAGYHVAELAGGPVWAEYVVTLR